MTGRILQQTDAPPSAVEKRTSLGRFTAKFGIKVKLQVAFAMVAVMTVIAAAVAIVSFSATERGFQGMVGREVPMMTDAMRLSLRSADITASSPDEKDPFFAPSADKVYRHPTFYDIPDDVPHM